VFANEPDGTESRLALFFGDKLVEAFAAVAATKNFHVEEPVENSVPEAALGIPHVDGKAFRAADVFTGGGLIHVDITHILAFASRVGKRAGMVR
jgi:hypothetical protein